MHKTILIITLIVVSICFFSGCTQQQNTTNEDNSKISKTESPEDTAIQYFDWYMVTYKVTGTGPASVTYANSQGGTEQRANVELPWEKKLTYMHEGDFVYISAQNNDEYGGYITVEIYLLHCYKGWSATELGTLVKKSTSRGLYTIATASGII